VLLVAVSAVAGQGEKPVVSRDASAKELVENCRTMIPRNVELSGRIILRSRRGIPISEYGYRLVRRNGETDLVLKNDDGQKVEFKREGRILGTDVTWSDLTLDYLWWDDVSFDADKESETAQGIICRVVLLKKGNRSVRIWIDKRTGAMLQAHEISEGKVVRELFCTSLKKFGERWAPRNIEVGPPGAKYRTKIVVEDVK
jgi:hypothetical protein